MFMMGYLKITIFVHFLGAAWGCFQPDFLAFFFVTKVQAETKVAEFEMLPGSFWCTAERTLNRSC